MRVLVAGGAGYSVLQVIEIARKVTGHPIPARMVPYRPGDPSMLAASSEKARAELGWAPRFPDLGDIILSASLVSLVRSSGRVTLIGEHADYNKIPNDLWL